MASTSSSCPVHGLRPRTRGWSVFSPRLASTGTLAGGGVCTWRGCEGALPWLPWWGGGRPILLFLVSPASEERGIRYRWHPCTFSMIRVEDPGSSFMLYLGPGPPSLLCMTRANAAKPYSGDTMEVKKLARFLWLYPWFLLVNWPGNLYGSATDNFLDYTQIWRKNSYISF